MKLSIAINMPDKIHYKDGTCKTEFGIDSIKDAYPESTPRQSDYLDGSISPLIFTQVFKTPSHGRKESRILHDHIPQKASQRKSLFFFFFSKNK